MRRSQSGGRGRSGITLLELLLVMAVMSLVIGISYPSMSSGIDSLRMRTATDSLAAFLNSGMSRVERLQQPIEITFTTGGSRLEMRGMRPQVLESLELPDGVTVVDFVPPPPGLEAGVRFVVLQPGSPFPAIGIAIENRRRARREVRIDPVAGIPIIVAP